MKHWMQAGLNGRWTVVVVVVVVGGVGVGIGGVVVVGVVVAIWPAEAVFER